MANENITPVSLQEIELFQNGERANADNLNRPIKTLRDNQIEQNRMLDEIYDLLGADDVDLDQLQELINKIKEFQDTLASDDTDLDSIQEIVNTLKSAKERLDKEHDSEGNHVFVDVSTGKKYKFLVDDGDIQLEEVE